MHIQYFIQNLARVVLLWGPPNYSRGSSHLSMHCFETLPDLQTSHGENVRCLDINIDRQIPTNINYSVLSNVRLMIQWRNSEL